MNAPGTSQLQREGETMIWTDGACSGNPGPGGWAAIVVTPDGETTELSGSESHTTNNRMEFTAAIEGLRSLPDDTPICIVTDSRLMIDSMTKWLAGWKRKGWKTAAGKPVKNQDLVVALDEQLTRHPGARWEWVKGHLTGADTALNQRADELAYTASQQEAGRL
jgi:ribonuclease HI